MPVEGYYYLHTNGDVIYKKRLDDAQMADFHESPFVVHVWQFDPEERAVAYVIVAEASALGAKPERIEELIAHWNITDEDAQVFAERTHMVLKHDDDHWDCFFEGAPLDGEDPQVGQGKRAIDAIIALCKAGPMGQRKDKAQA